VPLKRSEPENLSKVPLTRSEPENLSKVPLKRSEPENLSKVPLTRSVGLTLARRFNAGIVVVAKEMLVA
jgi:hypothetical protein